MLRLKVSLPPPPAVVVVLLGLTGRVWGYHLGGDYGERGRIGLGVSGFGV